MSKFVYILLSLCFLVSDESYMLDWKSDYNNQRLNKALTELQIIADSNSEIVFRLNKQLSSDGFAVLVELGKVDSFYSTLNWFQINEIVPIIDYQGALCEDYDYFDKFERQWNDRLESLWLKWKKNRHLRDLCNGIWDEGEEFQDTKGNGVWNKGENFRDTKGNGIWDEGEDFIDTLNEIWDKNEYFDDYGEDNCMDPWEDGEGGCLSRISKDYEKGDDPNSDNYTSSNPNGSQWNWSYDQGEYFIDDFNGIYDEGEEFTDLPDGVYNEGEWFEDLPDGAYSLGEQFLDLPCEALTPSCYGNDIEIVDTDFETWEDWGPPDVSSPPYRQYYNYRHDQKAILLSPLCINYPTSAKTRNVEGEIVLGLEVNRRGKVEFYGFKIIERTGTILDQAAVDALIFSSWEPATFQDAPTKVYYRLGIVFDLKSDCIKIEELKNSR